MTNTLDIDTLIRELGGSTEGSRDLSDKVLLASGWTFTANGYGPSAPCWGGGGLWTNPAGVGIAASDPRPSPTESFDAVLELLPEGWWWEKSLDSVITIGPTPYEVEHAFSGQAPTPVLAFCIAIIKARRESDKGTS